MGLRVYLATGGVPVDTDLKVLTRGSKEVPHCLIATPGRLFDLLSRKAVKPATVRVLVLDEADQLLDAKFKEQILAIMSEPFVWPATTQVALMSATMIPAIASIAKTLLVRDPVTILMDLEEVSLEGIRQFYVEVDRDDQKLSSLCDLSDCLKIQQAVIFVNSRKKVEDLADSMKREGFDLGFIHGDMDTKERKRRMDAFRSGETRVLITTDLLARGIDVQQISLVINYELPPDPSNYIHRIGRCGRFGRKGVAISLLTPAEKDVMDQIASHYSFVPVSLPQDMKGVVDA
jgi:translation initiation factor 4A